MTLLFKWFSLSVFGIGLLVPNGRHKSTEITPLSFAVVVLWVPGEFNCESIKCEFLCVFNMAHWDVLTHKHSLAVCVYMWLETTYAKLTEQEMNAIKGSISSRCFVFFIYERKFIRELKGKRQKAMGTTTLHGMCFFFICVCESRVHVPWYCIPVWNIIRCHITYGTRQQLLLSFSVLYMMCTMHHYSVQCLTIQTPFSHISSHFQIENFHRRMDIYTFLWYEST